MSFGEYVTEYVEEMNEQIRDEYGVRWLFCDDAIYEDFMHECDGEDNPLGICPEWGTIEGDLEIVKPIFHKWLKDTKIFSIANIEKKVQNAEDEHYKDMRTTMGESGYHSFACNGDGSYSMW